MKANKSNTVKLTKEQIQAYIDNEGEHCPYCESEHGVDDTLSPLKHCLNPECKKRWVDVISLCDISEIEE